MVGGLLVVLLHHAGGGGVFSCTFGPQRSV